MWHKQTNKPTPGGIGCILSPLFPTCQFRFLAADYKGAAGAKQCAFATIKQTTQRVNKIHFFLFYQSARCCLQDGDWSQERQTQTCSCFQRTLWTEKMDVRVYIFNTALPKSRVIEVFSEIFAYEEYSYMINNNIKTILLSHNKILCMNIMESLCFAFLLCHTQANTITSDE